MVVIKCVLTGPIGVGKSTLLHAMEMCSKHVKHDVEFHFIPEPIDRLRSQFDVFCENPEAADTWQVENLMHFYHHIQKYDKTHPQKIVFLIFERSPLCSKYVFTPLQEKHMRSASKILVSTVMDFVEEAWCDATYVFLDSDVSICQRNIRTRIRDKEEISEEYATEIRHRYWKMQDIVGGKTFDVSDLKYAEIPAFAEKLLRHFLNLFFTDIDVFEE